MRILAATGIMIGLLLALGQWSGRQPERDARVAASHEFGIPFEGRMIDVGEVRLHVVFVGPKDGPPVVLLHGFPEFWYAWRGPAATLARAGYRVVIPDQRGYNRSDKPAGRKHYRLDRLVADVIGLIDALGYETVLLGTQDVGGRVGWRVALEHPERIARFAVIDVPHPLAVASGEEETISWYRTFLQLPLVPGYAARLANWRLLSSNLRGTSAGGAFPETEMDQYRSAWNREGSIHSMGNWYRAPAWPLQGEGRVTLPTLILLAKDDRFIPASSTRASLAFLDDGRLLELGSGTHWVVSEEPERIGALLTAFFQSGYASGDPARSGLPD